MRTSQQVGNEFEQYVTKTLRTISLTHGLAFHRFADTKAAGNIIGHQPADYLVALGDTLTYLEAKASSTSKRLRPSMLRPAQRQAIQLYQRMLGCPYQVIFYSEVTKEIHLFSGTDVLKKDFSKHYLEYQLWAGDKHDMDVSLPEFWELEKLSEILADYQDRYEEQA